MPKHTTDWFMKSAVKRFWARIDKNGPTPKHVPELGPCWIWVGLRDRNGYGILSAFGSYVLAHRFALQLHEKAPLGGLCALHRCDVRPCVNPAHLYRGTKVDNQREADMKRRAGMTPEERVPGVAVKIGRGKAVGEGNGRSKVTEDDVREIRRLVAEEDMYMTEVAERFGLHVKSVDAIIRRFTWAHVV